MFDYESDFLTKVPSSWKLTPLKYTGEIENSGIWGEDEPFENSISLKVPTTRNISADGKFDVEAMKVRHIAVHEYKKYICKIGDIVIVKSSGSSDNVISGKCGYVDSNDEFSFGNFLMRIRPNPEIVVSKFLFFFLISHVTRERVLRMVSSTTYPNLKIDEYISSPIPVPHLEEQKLISRYLDNKTKQIDRLVEKIQKKIELLKEQRTSLINQCVTKGLDPNVQMKDSGLEWIGGIPKHWEVKKLKYIADVTLGKMLTPEDKGEMLQMKYLRSVNVQEDYLDLNDVNKMWFSKIEIQKLSILQGDILVNEGGKVGRTCFITKNLSDYGFQNSINRVRTNKIDSYYLYLLILLGFKLSYYDAIVDRVSIPHLTKEKLENSFIIQPPHSEQKLISKKIKYEISQFSIHLSKQEKKLSLIQEYRQSLISSVVTGKVRVTEDMI